MADLLRQTAAEALMRDLSRRCLGLLALMAFISASCDKSSPVQPTPPPCTFSLSASSLSFGAAGGVSSVAVTTAATCTWTAASDRGWMSISSGNTGTGTGTVNVAVTANTGAAERTATLTIAAQAVPVRQDAAAPCRIDISPTSASLGMDSATATFTVSAPEQCSWSATSHASWLAVISGASGTGSSTVTYAVERNRELSERTGTISVAERTFIVTQAGDPGPAPLCDYSVTPVVFTPCMTAPTLSASITTQQGCSWTAEADASWVTLTTGQSGSGPGVISFKVSDNWDAPRHGVIKVRWPTLTAGQNLQIQQAGCTYAVSTTLVNIASPGGSGRFDVIQQSDPYTCGGATQNGCLWTAVSDVPWITITTSMPQLGDNPVLFTVSATDATTPRTGRITVRDKVVIVTQAGR